VLEELKGVSNRGGRGARFKIVIALKLNNKTHIFGGIVSGEITLVSCGKGGFGYDSVFISEGLKTAFSEMSLERRIKLVIEALLYLDL
jgi:XTP/dITP diphosphohydrolase